MSEHEKEYTDLQRDLDELGRLYQPRHPGWETLLHRLPDRRPAEEDAALGDGAGNGLPRPATTRPWYRWRGWLAAAAAASLLIGFGVWLSVRPPLAPEGHGQPPVAMQKPPVAAQEPPGAVQKLPAVAQEPPVVSQKEEPSLSELATGCRVDPVGDAVYRVVEPRRVQLDRGELYVEVDRRRAGSEPFVVETPAGEAKAVGTRFVVETRSQELDRRDLSQDKGGSDMTAKFPSIAFVTRVLVLAGVVQLVGADVDAEGGAGVELKAQSVKPAVARYFSAPGYWMLSQERVRKEIEIVPEQEEKIRQIAKDYQEQVQKLYAPLREKKLDPQERMKAYQGLREKYQKLQEEAKAQIDKVLLPHQLQALDMIQLRTRAAGLLHSSSMLDRLGLTEEQKEKIRKNRTELREKIHNLNEEAFKEVLEILTPEQIEKLKNPHQILGRPAVFYGQGGSGTVKIRPAADNSRRQ